MKCRFALATLVALQLCAQFTGENVELGRAIGAAQAHARQDGDRLFPGFGRAPFGLLLVSGSHETLLCHNPVSGFTSAGIDPATKCTQQFRSPEHFSEKLLAAMPALDSESVIVMGTPQTTGLTRAQWIRTIYHEHFHQYETSLPLYFSGVQALELAGGDKTGMWMLNYPFPYQDAKVQAAYQKAASALADAVETRGAASYSGFVKAYKEARASYASIVSEPAWRYFEFELWQEGTAQWMEIALGKTDSDPTVQESAKQLESWSLQQLRTASLGDRKREVVYAIGTAEAMLMEACDPHWRLDFPKTLQMGSLLSNHSCQ